MRDRLIAACAAALIASIFTGAWAFNRYTIETYDQLLNECGQRFYLRLRIHSCKKLAAIARTPEEKSPFQNQLCEALGRVHDWKRALKACKSVYAPNLQTLSYPLQAAYYSNLGAAELATGQLDDALRNLGTAIELNPKLCNAYYNRELAEEARGEKEKAAADAAKIKELKRKPPQQ